MSFNQKIISCSFILIIIVFVGGSWYYKKTHPKYVPPPPREEITLTIIPGWNLRQIAQYLVENDRASSTEEVFEITGKSAVKYDKSIIGPSDELIESAPEGSTMEGYLAPETIRVFADADLYEVVDRFYFQRVKEITPEMYGRAKELKKTMHQILTMASLLEKEVRTPADKAKVADIMWRRLAKNWALQLDSTVHYVVDDKGEDVFTSGKEREVDSPWNTYKYPGLPPGPICSPSVASIKAALYPEKNNYWYFLTGKDGTVYYGRTLEEHNANKRYL